MSSVERAGAGPYPHGVATPLQAHVHPYPTRFHGAIYTRPVFGFPYVRNPHAVFKPNDFHDFYTGNPTMNGLGALQFTTRRGVFGPGGHGGGVFQTAQTMGFGQDTIDTQAQAADVVAQAAAALPYGVYSANTVQWQNSLNDTIKAKGYSIPLLKADGILGPETCTASAAVAAASGSSSFTVPACSRANAATLPVTPATPTPASTAAPSLGPGPSPALLSMGPGGGDTVGGAQRTFLWILGGLAVVGVGYAIYKNKGR
jgi:hypothetical protein